MDIYLSPKMFFAGHTNFFYFGLHIEKLRSKYAIAASSESLKVGEDREDEHPKLIWAITQSAKYPAKSGYHSCIF